MIFTAASVFTYVTTYGNFVAASDRPFTMTMEARLQNLSKFQFNGRAILDGAEATRQTILGEMAASDLSDKAEQIRHRPRSAGDHGRQHAHRIQKNAQSNFPSVQVVRSKHLLEELPSHLGVSEGISLTFSFQRMPCRREPASRASAGRERKGERCAVAGVIVFILFGLLNSPALAVGQVGLYDVWEIQIVNSRSYANPFDFTVIELQATFTGALRADESTFSAFMMATETGGRPVMFGGCGSCPMSWARGITATAGRTAQQAMQGVLR